MKHAYRFALGARFPSARLLRLCRNLVLWVAVLAILPLAGPAAAPAAASADAAVPAPDSEPTMKAAVVNDGQAFDPAFNVYLPLVVGSGQGVPPPASRYAPGLS